MHLFVQDGTLEAKVVTPAEYGYLNKACPHNQIKDFTNIEMSK